MCSGLLAAAAILTKQSLLGPAVCGTLWLVLVRPRHAVLYAATVLGVGLGTVLVLQLSSGGAFWANTVGGNSHQPFDALTFRINFTELLTFLGVPVLVALLGSVRPGLPRDLVALNWLGALLPMVPMGSIGADSNYWLEFAALTAVLAVAGVWAGRAHWTGALGALFLTFGVVAATSGVLRTVLGQPAYVLPAEGDRAVLGQLIERVAGTPGVVLADPLDVLVLADRPILLEPIIYSLLERDGSWDSRFMVQQLCRGEIGLIVLGYPLAEMGQRFPESVAAVVQERFVLAETVALAGRSRYVLVPAPISGSCQT
jgi:hypothetical protein